VPRVLHIGTLRWHIKCWEKHGTLSCHSVNEEDKKHGQTWGKRKEPGLRFQLNSRSGCACDRHFSSYKAKLPNSKLKTRPKLLLGSLLIYIARPAKHSWHRQLERQQQRDIKGRKVWTIAIHSLQLRTSG